MKPQFQLIALVLAASFVLAGCLTTFVPAGTKIHSNTHTSHIPSMKGDDRIVYTRCYVRSSPLAKVQCYATLSNGVSDLINDLHTGLDIIDWIADLIYNADPEGWLQSRVKSRCRTALNDALDNALDDMPGIFGTVANSYADQQITYQRITNWCDEAVDLAWAETDDNVYSGGHKCATARVTVDVTSVNLPPDVSFYTYDIDEDSSACPRARVVFPVPVLPDPHWGND